MRKGLPFVFIIPGAGVVPKNLPRLGILHCTCVEQNMVFYQLPEGHSRSYSCMFHLLRLKVPIKSQINMF